MNIQLVQRLHRCYTQRDATAAEKAALIKEKAALVKELEAHANEKSGLAKQNDTRAREMEALAKERDALAAEVKSVTAASVQLQQQMASKSGEPNTTSKVWQVASLSDESCVLV